MNNEKSPLEVEVTKKTPSAVSKVLWVAFGVFSFSTGVLTASFAGLYFGILPEALATIAQQSQTELLIVLGTSLERAEDLLDLQQLSIRLSNSEPERVASTQAMLIPAPLAMTIKPPYDFQIFAPENQNFSQIEDVERISIAAPAIEFDRDAVLKDFDHRISPDFAVSAGLRERAGFWFDVYSKYDSNKRIIHHSRYPWIVYKVIDVAPIINAEVPRHRWLRNEKADKLVQSEVKKIRAALNSVAHRSNMKQLSSDEKLVADALSKLDGSPKKLAVAAAGDLRVQVGQRNFFQEGLEVSPRYLVGMEEIFRRYKLPVELTRIPFVESSFNKQATSKVGASGVWQFMGNTGRKFMVVNDHIDERRSPYKATEAAARLLKENHLILHHSWPLAVTAWNHGPPGLRKGISIAHSQDLSVIISRYRSKSFDFASSNFYTEFLGALYAEKYSHEIFGDVTRKESLDARPVLLSKAMRGKDILKRCGLKADEFELLNPDLQRAVQVNASIPAGFRLMLTESSRLAMGASVKKPSANSKQKMFAALAPAASASQIQ